MCGICGVYYFSDGDPTEPDPTRSMARALTHRGPDSDGFHSSGRVRLGHRRLEIIDVAGGSQPMCNEDGTVWVSFNGEIFNFQDLRIRLEARGHRFLTRSDTEVLVHLYEEDGEQMVDRLRGQFAFAIWDEPRERLFLARDRIGIKPLYYAMDRGRCLFASELKGLLPALGRTPPVDEKALLEYLTYLYVPAPRTIFRDAQKLPPGHWLSLTPQGARIRRYWDLAFPDREDPVDEAETATEILERLRESVKMRLMSEVPLGAFLSGGMDSSAVSALMAEGSPDPIRTFTVGFREASHNELPQARAMADRIGSRHFEKVVSAEPERILDRISTVFDEPFADSSALPTYTVCGVTREHVTVALSGDGGDENFAGYRRYYFDRLENRLRFLLPSGVRSSLIGPLARIYPKADWLPRIFRGKTLLSNLARDGDRGYFLTQSAIPREILDSMLHPDMRARTADHDPFEAMERHFLRAPRDPLSRIQYVDFMTYLPDDILTKVDRAAMAHSLEVRVPLLDHPFVERVAEIPSSLKLRGRVGKYIFRKALAGVVPVETLHRRKMGFSVPLARWMKHELAGAFQDCLNDSRMEEFFDLGTLGRMWGKHRSRVSDFSTPLYSVLAFHRWYCNFGTYCRGIDEAKEAV